MIGYINFTQKIKTMLQCSFTILHSSQQDMIAPVAHHLPTLGIVSLLILSILIGMRWYFIMVWIWVSLGANNVEHFLTCLLPSYPLLQRGNLRGKRYEFRICKTSFILETIFWKQNLEKYLLKESWNIQIMKITY